MENLGPVYMNPEIWEDIDGYIKNFVLSLGLALESPLALTMGIVLKINPNETTSGGGED